MLEETATPEYLDAQIAVAQQAFALMADFAVSPAPAASALFSTEIAAGATIRAVIHYWGNFEGSLCIELAPSTAYAFTERSMGVDPPQAFTSEVNDAIGELINTIAGTLKEVLPGNNRVSMPQVFAPLVLRDESGCGPCLSIVNFDSEFGAFRLSLLATLR